MSSPDILNQEETEDLINSSRYNERDIVRNYRIEGDLAERSRQKLNKKAASKNNLCKKIITSNSSKKLQCSVNLQSNNEIKNEKTNNNNNKTLNKNVIYERNNDKIESSNNTIQKCQCKCLCKSSNYKSKSASNLKTDQYKLNTNKIASTLQPTKESQTHYNNVNYSVTDEINNLPKSASCTTDSLFDTSTTTDNYQDDKILSNFQAQKPIYDVNQSNYYDTTTGTQPNADQRTRYYEGFTNEPISNKQKKSLEKIQIMYDAINEVKELDRGNDLLKLLTDSSNLSNYYNNLVSPSSNLSRLRQDPVGREDKDESHYIRKKLLGHQSSRTHHSSLLSNSSIENSTKILKMNRSSSISSRQDPIGSEDTNSYQSSGYPSNLPINNFAKKSFLRQDPIGQDPISSRVSTEEMTEHYRTRLSKNSRKQQQNHFLDDKKLSNLVKTRRNQVKPNNKISNFHHLHLSPNSTAATNKLSVNQVLANEYISKYLGPSPKLKDLGSPRFQRSTHNTHLLATSSPASGTTSSGNDSGLPKESSIKSQRKTRKSISRAEQILQAKLERQLQLNDSVERFYVETKVLDLNQNI